MKKVPNWVVYVVASLAVLLSIGVTLNLVLSQTLLSSTYLETKLDETNAYRDLSTAISDEFTKNLSEAERANPDEAAIVKSVVTPEVVQEKLTDVLTQAEDYLKNDGPAPVLDLTDVVAEAREAGLDIPADSDIAQPITIGSAEENQQLSQQLNNSQLASTIFMVVAGISVVALIALCVVRRDYRVLGTAAIVYGAVFILLGLLLWLGASQGIGRTETGSDIFAGVAQRLAKATAEDHAQRFALIGGIALVIGVIARIVFAKLHRPAGFTASR